jgi:hypothetical protein
LVRHQAFAGFPSHICDGAISVSRQVRTDVPKK